MSMNNKEDWVSEELLMLYEQTYRELKRVALSFELDTTIMDQARNELMKKYGLDADSIYQACKSLLNN